AEALAKRAARPEVEVAARGRFDVHAGLLARLLDRPVHGGLTLVEAALGEVPALPRKRRVDQQHLAAAVDDEAAGDGPRARLAAQAVELLQHVRGPGGQRVAHVFLQGAMSWPVSNARALANCTSAVIGRGRRSLALGPLVSGIATLGVRRLAEPASLP